MPKARKFRGNLKAPKRGAARGTAPTKRAIKTKQPAASGRDVVAATQPLQPDKDRFLVVGIGASAGGLEAVRRLLAEMPAKTGFAFVLIQHLDPTHKSMMAELLASDTAMKVVQASDGMPLERNCLHIIPPQADLSLDHGVLRISRPSARHGGGVDFFLGSLARECGERAVAIILSGTGSDGSAGVKAVSESGGLVIAQDPEEATYAGMPRSAIATGAVNLVLPAERIPRALLSYAQHPYVTARPKKIAPIEEEAERSLEELVALLRARTSRDFAQYKKATLLRRTQRRMAAAGIKEFAVYIKLLRRDNRELGLLAKDLLIHVTSFFRDPDTFAALAKTVIRELVRQHGEDCESAWGPDADRHDKSLIHITLEGSCFSADSQSSRPT